MTWIPAITWLLVAVVAVLHFGFMAAEMFWWPDTALRVGGYEKTLADSVEELGWNQGLYNGFLAAGLIWSLKWPRKLATHIAHEWQWPVDRRLAVFFLACVLIAGVYGGLTIQRPNPILLGVQALPALLALLAIAVAQMKEPR
jgi:putative membrane protein